MSAVIEAIEQRDSEALLRAIACDDAEYLANLNGCNSWIWGERDRYSHRLTRYLLEHGLKTFDAGAFIVKLKQHRERLSPSERRRKRAATMFWHPGAMSEFWTVTIEKKAVVQ